MTKMLLRRKNVVQSHNPAVLRALKTIQLIRDINRYFPTE